MYFLSVMFDTPITCLFYIKRKRDILLFVLNYQISIFIIRPDIAKTSHIQLAIVHNHIENFQTVVLVLDFTSQFLFNFIEIA